MPNYRRSKIAGGTYFFYGDELPSAADIDDGHAATRSARRGSANALTLPFRHRRLGAAARSLALHLDAAAGRCRFFAALGDD